MIQHIAARVSLIFHSMLCLHCGLHLQLYLRLACETVFKGPVPNQRSSVLCDER
jgi:hypothetical protein